MNFELKLKTLKETPETRKWLDEVADKIKPEMVKFYSSPEYKKWFDDYAKKLFVFGQAEYTDKDLQGVVDAYLKRVNATN